MDPKSASDWEQTFEYVPLTVCTTNQGKEWEQKNLLAE
jgi:hypothetical protein